MTVIAEVSSHVIAQPHHIVVITQPHPTVVIIRHRRIIDWYLSMTMQTKHFS